MLDKTCLLFLIPVLTGYVQQDMWVCYGCAILTMTSSLYYNFLNMKALQILDTVYASTFTVLSAGIGIQRAGYGCYFNMVGVLCAIATFYVYLTKSQRWVASKDDHWHILVHLFGSIAFVLMSFGSMQGSTHA